MTLNYTASTGSQPHYVVHYGYTGSVNKTTDTSCRAATTCTITGLTNGISYTFAVAAGKTSGTSPDSNAVDATPAGPPATPTIGTAARGDSLATVSFTSGSTGGDPTTYTATSTPGGMTGSCTGSPCSVRGLTNGTSYTFTVTATNSVGSSGASAPSTARPTPSRSPPRTVSAPRRPPRRRAR